MSLRRVDDLETSETQRVMTSTIVSLSLALGKYVIAEGVERTGQAQFLEQIGCQAVQGYLVARPMSIEAFVPWAHRHRMTTSARTGDSSRRHVALAVPIDEGISSTALVRSIG